MLKKAVTLTTIAVGAALAMSGAAHAEPNGDPAKYADFTADFLPANTPEALNDNLGVAAISGQVEPSGADGGVGLAQADPAEGVFLHAVVDVRGAGAAAGDGAGDAVRAHDQVLALLRRGGLGGFASQIGRHASSL
ncbi:hypothetical protein [Nocardia sp. NBC_01009]|uniref:hypothetical protein n=1 Tax=Nocardia sp. NBC_01009 TaxID=2975996 RepID=UPI00386FA4B2|nr:hypothetical protein OHA42_00890 [Nocardia sp. NBC_01009]